MKINRVKLYNFSSYEGMNEFDFEITDKKKNIILIGGKNGAGKTSLFAAIKVALYGPLAYGYVGVNPHYISKIKDLINSKAFQQEKVESEIQIVLQLKIERDVRNYIITRKWDYTEQKLVEEYTVEKEGITLDEQELSYFENYLLSIIPPELFEFFLFDGEEVGNIFSTSAYNSYVRNAVFILCGMDVFEIIRKYTRSHVAKGDYGENDDYLEMFETTKNEIEQLQRTKSELEKIIEGLNSEIEDIGLQLIELGSAFKNAGGITRKEKARLEEEYNQAEKVKSETLAKIKLFVEGLMPFYILKDFVNPIMDQMDFEEKSEIFYYVQQKVNKSDIEEILSDNVGEEKIKQLLDHLLSKFRPRGFREDTEMRFDLSREETGRINGIISAIEDFNREAMIENVKRRREAADITAEINRILKSSMSEDEVNNFAKRENALLKKKEASVSQLYDAQRKLETVRQELLLKEQTREKTLQTIKNNAQSRHVYELSSGLSQMMDQLLESKTENIRHQLEDTIVRNLKTIYRKNNLITHIEIGKNFEFNLYQDENYNIKELSALFKNLGTQEFSALIGSKGQEALINQLGMESISEIKGLKEIRDGDKSVRLYKKIELGRLSKGERQIFILALYWAVIEVSGQDIPFVIDTPYARIDANHRREISEKFFPNISSQVIILSTDEEINEEYYRIIKPYVSKEYLLLNDENENRTSIENHYFFEV
ncbi:MAG: AAA family ATPase [Lachnospiraceae bacterium]|nr:AAA family ATPase [Lachnospiraceae bacterium]